MARLQNKVALITGAGAGIGKVIAEMFVQEGAKVVLVDWHEAELAEVDAALPADQSTYYIADVSVPEQVQAYVDHAVKTFGRIDIFVNNAAIEGQMMPIIEQTLENFDRVQAINVRGAFVGLQAVMRVMQQQGGGSIINMSSVAGLAGSALAAPYVASKHALTGLTKCAALEGAADKIRVNSVHPSPVNTRMMRSIEEMFQPGHAEDTKHQLETMIPLGRYGESEEIAYLTLFLASDESQFITGANYRIDGGMGAK
jgi:NAD(P)-dependent dehydrogenase (short-subunit alcohol dehydrogenase family)